MPNGRRNGCCKNFLCIHNIDDMQSLPLYIYLVFGATVLITFWLILKASRYSKILLAVSVLLIFFQSSLALMGFYNDPATMSKKFPLLLAPALILILIAFITKGGRRLLDRLDLPTLTLLHTIRIPVELVLLSLYLHHTIPRAMTFEGSNFDIFSGISAPLMYYFVFVKKKLSRSLLLVWNLVCLALLAWVVSRAILSLPDRFERFNFEQPNIAVGYFPFILLPAFIVPVVLFSTLASMRQLFIIGRNSKNPENNNPSDMQRGC